MQQQAIDAEVICLHRPLNTAKGAKFMGKLTVACRHVYGGGKLIGLFIQLNKAMSSVH